MPLSTQHSTLDNVPEFRKSTKAAPTVAASVTPAPLSALKADDKNPISDRTGGDTPAAVFTLEGDNERILPAEKAKFEDNYANFRRIIRDLSDAHNRGDSDFLAMKVEFASANAETLLDHGDLSMVLESLHDLTADLDSQMAEYEAFLKS